MAFTHPATTLFSSVSLAVSSSATSANVDATAGAGALVEIRVTVPSGTQTGAVTVQPYHAPTTGGTFYPWGPALNVNPLVPVAATPGYFDWQAPPEGGAWQFVVSGVSGAAVTLDGRATVLTPG